MNKGNYMGRAQQNVPASTYGLDFIQQQILLAAEVAKLAGYDCILSGCQETGNNVAPGILIISGELLPFLGGAKQSKVRIVQTEETVTSNTEIYDQLYVHRHVEFGSNLNDIDTFNWSNFTPVLTNRQLSDTLMRSKATERQLVTPSEDVLTNRLYWYIDAIGDFVLTGYIILKEGSAGPVTICTLPLSSYYETNLSPGDITYPTSSRFCFFASNLGTDVKAQIIIMTLMTGSYDVFTTVNLRIEQRLSGRIRFNYRLPVFGKNDNGYLV
jgi:hypothetical protein